MRTMEQSFADGRDAAGAALCINRDTLLMMVGSTATFSSDGILTLDTKNSGADEGLPGGFVCEICCSCHLFTACERTRSCMEGVVRVGKSSVHVSGSLAPLRTARAAVTKWKPVQNKTRFVELGQ